MPLWSQIVMLAVAAAAVVMLVMVLLIFYTLFLSNPKDKEGISLRRWPVDVRKKELEARGRPDDDVGKPKP